MWIRFLKDLSVCHIYDKLAIKHLCFLGKDSKDDDQHTFDMSSFFDPSVNETCMMAPK
jgi:hypothetical protein